MNLLSIGNSFSQDAHKWLHKLAEQNAIDLETVNLYIGGCSLEIHWNNVKSGLADYDLEQNGEEAQGKISILEALTMRKWDAITVQQVSQDSGRYETFEPYLSSLVSFVREKQPDAKLYFHQTWAYETDSGHFGFANYHHDQKEMFRCIQEASQKAARSVDAALIPAGSVIQSLRDTVPEFSYGNGGLSLCRDGFHLSWDYGRFAAAATWLRAVTGQKIKAGKFEEMCPALLEKILAAVNE